MGYSLEVLYEIWDDKTGNKIEVGPDRDALGLVEIRMIEDGKRVADVTMSVKQAELVARAIDSMTTEGLDK